MRVITENPDNAYCDLRGTKVEVVDIFPDHHRRLFRSIAKAKIVSVGPHYKGRLFWPGKLILLYRGVSKQLREDK